MEFPLAAGGYQYRALKLADPMLSGWDVYSLQTGLNASIGAALSPDGYLGPKTSKAISQFQMMAHLVPLDAVAGVMTQRAIVLSIIPLVPDKPITGLLKGQLEKESSYWLGNYTAKYPDGSRDQGVAQRNSNYTPNRMEAFDVADSIEALARQVCSYHGKYVGLGVADRRAWELGAGSWNAPAYTDALAKGQTSVLVGGVRIDLSPGAPARVRIEAYMAAATIYCF